MKLVSPLLFAAAFAAASLAPAATFEGKVRLKLTETRGQTHEIAYSVKDGFTRMDVEAGKGQTATIITDTAKQEMTILIPGQSMYMVRPMPDMSAMAEKAGTGDDVSLEKTNETETILGYPCTKYVATSKEGRTDVWATDQLGVFMGLSMGGGPMGGRRGGGSGQKAWEKALMGKDFFPLRVVTHDSDSKEKFRMEAVSVEKQSLPNSLFAPPAGYQKFDMGNMMRGMGGGS